ncbi:MAG: chromosomal replication initiator protein DnaA [Dehalococcoidia bacterium]|nr:chromosomal replication initiator protein DnaA [Dehalococcoidia bacterium]
MPSLPPRVLWQAVLGELEVQMAKPSYETFLKDTTGTGREANRLMVATPSPFVAEYLQQKLYALVARTVERVAKEPLEVSFLVAPNGGDAAKQRDGNGGQPPRDVAPRPLGTLALNLRYTFETFIVGKSNQLAHAAAVAAADYPGQKYNPVFLYSGVGLGKTHLLHAIAHRVLARGLSMLYLSAEQFTNEFVTAIREGRAAEFNAKFSGVDVLLVDDVYSLAGKEQTQEKLFHLFNERHQANRQIVLTSDRPPAALTSLGDRLRSRFAMGLIGDIQTPDLEMRLAILRSKAEQSASSGLVPDDVLLMLAQKVQRSVRELEGNLNRVLALAELTGKPVTRELAAQALAGLEANRGSRSATPEEIVALVARHYGLSPDALRGPVREKKVALARHVAMFLLQQELNVTLSQIGRVLGGRDHSTVDHACKRVEVMSNVDAGLRTDLVTLREALEKPSAGKG